MKKVGLIIFASALIIGLVCANAFTFGQAKTSFFSFSLFEGVKGSGNIVSEKRDLSGFNGVDVGGVFKVDITAQKDFSVSIEADDNLLPFIKTEVRDGILKISTDGRIKTSNSLRVHISAPDISDLNASGASNVTLTGVKNSSLSVDSSGASKIEVGGETSNLTVDVSGASKIQADDLKTVDANIDASGASSVYVNVSGVLKSDASGASRVTYGGSPTNVQKKTSGASRVSPK